MNHTSRMTALLAAFRRERNGAVADAMRPYGTPCGLNYGVSLPTLRRIVAAEAAGEAADGAADDALARYLWRQDVRELRLAALHLADAARLSGDGADGWVDGIATSEEAEEAAFALLRHAEGFDALFAGWIARADRPLVQYAALLAAARRDVEKAEWVDAAVEAVAGADRLAAAVPPAVDRYAARLVAQGAVALCAAFGGVNGAARSAVLRAIGMAGEGPAACYLREELAWRLPDTEA